VNLADAGGVVAVPEDLPAWFVGIGHLTVEAILAHLNLVRSGAGGFVRFRDRGIHAATWRAGGISASNPPARQPASPVSTGPSCRDTRTDSPARGRQLTDHPAPLPGCA
jgi:hypothetical protein